MSRIDLQALVPSTATWSEAVGLAGLPAPPPLDHGCTNRVPAWTEEIRQMLPALERGPKRSTVELLKTLATLPSDSLFASFIVGLGAGEAGAFWALVEFAQAEQGRLGLVPAEASCWPPRAP